MSSNPSFKSIYVNKDLHKRIKLFCITHDIRNMQVWVEPILEAALAKPKAKDRLEKQALELTPEQKAEIDAETQIPKPANTGRIIPVLD